jgi:hypothetical protein
MRFPPNRVTLAILVVLLIARVAPGQTGAAVPPSPSPTPPSHKASTKPRAKKASQCRETGKAECPQKVVVRRGGTTEALPQMAPAVPGSQESSERRKSGQLLTATEANLKKLGDRKLSSEQQATVAQIRQFMDQSRAALDEGDVTQGYNLAYKANVLSEELNKH